MISTDINIYIDSKNKEHILLQKLLLESSLTGENVVYQKFNYTSSFLNSKLKNIENQIKGAINIIEYIANKKWSILNLSFIENLAKEEFIYHVAIDSKYYNILSEKLIDKIIFSLESDEIHSNLSRLKNLRDKLIFNLRRYGDIDYKQEWVTDRYFELASFIEFNDDLSVLNNNSYTNHSIYDIVISGEKTIDDMKKGGVYYDVLKFKYNTIKENSSKDILYLMNQKSKNNLQ